VSSQPSDETKLLTVLQLFNDFADNAGYYDICLLIYAVADHRDVSQIKSTWQQLFQSVHDESIARDAAQPYEMIAEKIRGLGRRLRLSESIFPIPLLLPMLEKYAFEYQRGVASSTWVIDLFLELQVGCEKLFDVLESMWYANEAPFYGRNRGILANDSIYVIEQWLHETIKGGGTIFDSEASALRIDQMLQTLLQTGAQAGLDGTGAQKCRLVRERIAQILH
jgi:nuclear pore complex protein Nup155